MLWGWFFWFTASVMGVICWIFAFLILRANEKVINQAASQTEVNMASAVNVLLIVFMVWCAVFVYDCASILIKNYW